MTKKNYTAPALEKGLAILRLLARQQKIMSASEIAAELGRSKAELYRMLLTLETQGYICRDETGTGYAMTSRLFELGMQKPERQALVTLSAPHMQTLARETGQSCHLTVVSQDAIVVIARAESETNFGFSIKIGFRVSAINGTSARIFYAFQPRHQQAEWLRWIRAQAPRQELRAFLEDARIAGRQGYFCRDSFYTQGVTDLVAPIMVNGRSIAALVIPFIDHINNPVRQTDALQKLIVTARQISYALQQDA